jgi:hypothetical protein
MIFVLVNREKFLAIHVTTPDYTMFLAQMLIQLPIRTNICRTPSYQTTEIMRTGFLVFLGFSCDIHRSTGTPHLPEFTIVL